METITIIQNGKQVEYIPKAAHEAQLSKLKAAIANISDICTDIDLQQEKTKQIETSLLQLNPRKGRSKEAAVVRRTQWVATLYNHFGWNKFDTNEAAACLKINPKAVHQRLKNLHSDGFLEYTGGGGPGLTIRWGVTEKAVKSTKAPIKKLLPLLYTKIRAQLASQQVEEVDISDIVKAFLKEIGLPKDKIKSTVELIIKDTGSYEHNLLIEKEGDKVVAAVCKSNADLEPLKHVIGE